MPSAAGRTMPKAPLAIHSGIVLKVPPKPSRTNAGFPARVIRS
jgi:hypothetical protein